jgi:hypothetical protein
VAAPAVSCLGHQLPTAPLLALPFCELLVYPVVIMIFSLNKLFSYSKQNRLQTEYPEY